MRRIPPINALLFFLTLLTTLAAGAVIGGVNIFENPWGIVKGAPFSLTLMFILLSHEFSHYLASRKHHTEATLPYFIPAPTLIGTFGAFIKMKSPIRSRKALVDIGASGPMVGFFFSVIASVAGLLLSRVVTVEAGAKGALTVGDSLLFAALTKLTVGTVPEGHEIFLHPVAFAGWLGLFVTSLNLIPVGQLDGGHISFAFLGPLHRRVGMALVAVLVGLSFFWVGWAVWAGLMLVIGLGHPPVIYWEEPLDPRRKLAGWAALVIFVITFIPAPFSVSL
ncbi:MAG: site-2 protease family protein [Nitrospirota bacterium]